MSPTSSFPDLAGKVVLVTGASRGIGEAVSVASQTGRVCRRRGLSAELAALEHGRDKTRALSSGMMQELFMRTSLA